MKRSLRLLICMLMLTSMAGLTYAEPAEKDSASSIVVSQPIIKVIRGHIEITISGNESKEVVCYSLTGQVVKTLTVHPGTTTFELPSGYYIIRCDRYSQRVIVR